LPTGKLLLLRARDPQKKCIATGIYLALNEVEAFYWGNASFRQSQHYRPNELLNWYAIRYWKQRGFQVFDWGGADYCRRFKAKFGAQPSSYPRFRKSRFAFLGILRQQAEGLFSLKRRFAGMFHPSSDNAHRFDL
jgi:lipid II:glycine glycyltransferase (peptidoglycan interpeptide bridge formation enzyme)